MAEQTRGYIYCFSNPYIPGLLKIGLTGRNLKERLREANGETYSPPFWKIEFAKLVENCDEAERKIHRALETYSQRLTSKREFFTCTLEQARNLFELLSGEWYIETPIASLLPPSSIESPDTESVEQTDTTTTGAKKEMRQYMLDGTLIQHRTNNGSTWTAKFDLSRNCIVQETEGGIQVYPSPTAFAVAHVRSVNPEASDSRSGWKECYAFVDGWKPMFKLPALT